jgi:hypothetical protein
MLPGNTGFRITYSDFIARAGGGVAATEFRKNCQVNLLVYIPGGFTFAVARAVRSLNINAELRVDAGTATGTTSYISLRASEGDVYTVVQFQWKQC